MSEVPSELEGFVDDIAERVSEEVSDAVVDDLLDDLTTELPPKLVQELQGGELEPLAPSKGLKRFRKKKKKDVKASTFGQHETKLGYVEEYFVDVLGLENLNDLTSRQAEDYEDWRECDSLDREEPLAQKTLKDDMHLYKEFLGHMVKARAVPADAYEIVEVPELENGEGIDEEKLDPDRAGDILVYLGRFEYASHEHVTWLLFLKIGRRPCDLHALDLGDFDDEGDEVTLEFVNRPEKGTRLKEGNEHEAKIELPEETGKVIRDFIENHRPSETDGYGREPLLATVYGRISKSTLQEYANKWTRPCAIGKDCPYGKDIENCEAANSAKKATQCEGTRSPRQIRSGYITSKANARVPYESIGYRVGATKEVLKKHYDLPGADEERQRYSDDIKGSNVSDDSGYANGSDNSGS